MSETRSMTDTKDLVDRLRKAHAEISPMFEPGFKDPWLEAAAALEAQAGEIERFDGINEELGRLMNENAGLRSQLSECAEGYRPPPWMNEVVAAVQMRDFVLVFTKDGTVYRLYWDSLLERIVIQKELVVLE